MKEDLRGYTENKFQNLNDFEFENLLGLDKKSGLRRLDPEKINKIREIFLRMLLGNKPQVLKKIKSEAKNKNLNAEDLDLEYQKRLQIQKDSINHWMDYLELAFQEENFRFDSKFILTVFQALSKMRPQGENQEIGEIKFGKRNKGIWAGFPRFNEGALARSFDEYKKLEDVKNYAPENFKIQYTNFINESDLATDKEIGALPSEYEWKIFEDGENPENAEKLKNLQKLSLETPGNWCTQGFSTAKEYTSDSGKMYILVAKAGSKNKEVAFAAIRIKNNNIAEVRGRNPGQNMPLSAGKVVGEKLRELQESGISGTEKEIQKVEGLKILMDLADKISNQGNNFNPLSLNSKEFEIFTKIKPLPKGFGYRKDEVVEGSTKIIKSSQEKFLNPNHKDFNRNIFNQIKQKLVKVIKDDENFSENLENKNNLKAKNIAYFEKDINENTKIFMGDFYYQSVPKEKQKFIKNLEVIMGYGNFKFAKNLNLSSLKIIGGFGDFGHVKNLNLSSLKAIGGDGSFYSARNIDLSSLEEIGRHVNFNHAQNLDLSSLKEIGGDVNFQKAQNLNLSSLEKIVGSEYFDSAENFIMNKEFSKKYPKVCVKSEEDKNKVLNSLKYTRLLGEISSFIASFALDEGFKEKSKKFEDLKGRILESQENIFENVESMKESVGGSVENILEEGSSINDEKINFEIILRNFYEEFKSLKA